MGSGYRYAHDRTCTDKAPPSTLSDDSTNSCGSADFITDEGEGRPSLAGTPRSAKAEVHIGGLHCLREAVWAQCDLRRNRAALRAGWGIRRMGRGAGRAGTTSGGLRAQCLLMWDSSWKRASRPADTSSSVCATSCPSCPTLAVSCSRGVAQEGVAAA